MKKLLSLLCMLLMLSMPAMAAVLMPGENLYFLDQAEVLSPETEEHILDSNDALYDACSAQIAVLAINSTDGEPIDAFSAALFNRWGIGSRENNGVLILMAIQDDDYYVLTGKALENTLTSDQLTQLNDEYLEPDFAASNYDTGARKLYDALFDRVSGIYSTGLTAENAAEAAIAAESAAAEAETEPESQFVETPEKRTGFLSSVRNIVRKVLLLLLIPLMTIVLIVGIVASRARRNTARSRRARSARPAQQARPRTVNRAQQPQQSVRRTPTQRPAGRPTGSGSRPVSGAGRSMRAPGSASRPTGANRGFGGEQTRGNGAGRSKH